MTKQTLRALLLLGCSIGASCPALADQRTDTGVYLGAGLGVSTIDSNLSLDKEDGFAGHATIGWQLTPHFGFETTYHNFAEAEDPQGTLSKFDVNGTSIAGTLRLPMSERIAFFARAGGIWWESDVVDTNCSRSPAGCITDRYNVEDSSGFLGLGLGYEMTSMLELELSYDNFSFDYDQLLLRGFDHEKSVVALTLKMKFW